MVEDLARSALAVVMAVGWALAAWAVARRLAGPGRPLIRWLATAVLLAWLPSVAFHLLSFAGGFSIGPAAIACVLAGAAGSWLLGGVEGARAALARERVFLARAGRLVRRSRHRYGVGAFVLLAAPGLLRAAILPPLGWDSLTYHAVKSAMWVQGSGSDSMVGPGTWAYYRDMLGGGEALAAWVMLPMHADTLTGVLEAGQWTALGLALFVLARRLGVREPYSSTSAAFVLSIPTVRLILGSGYVELGLLFSLAAGVALALSGLGRRPGLLALAGASFGVAAATKLPMVPVCSGLLALVVARTFIKGRREARGLALAGVAAFAAVLGPWMLVTYRHTGAPFAPFAFRLLGVELGHAPPEVAWYLDRPVPAASALAAEASSLMQVFHLPLTRSEALGVFALIPLAWAPFRLPALWRRSPFGAVLLGFAIAVSALTYFSQGFAPIRYRWADSSSRFLLPVVALAVSASLAGSSPRSAGWRRYGMLLRVVAWFLLALYAFYGFSPASLIGTAILLVGGVTLGAGARLASRTRRAMAPLALGLAVVAGVFGLSVLRDALRYEFIRMDVALHVTPRYWAGALPLVDRPGEARRIAVTSGPWQDLDNWLAYPLMGRRLQNRVIYVPVARDGTVTHFSRGTTNDTIAGTADYDSWMARLGERRVTEVMSFKPASLELSWMDGHPEAFERLAGLDGHWGLYRLRDHFPPPR